MRIEPGKTDGGHLAHIANPMKFSASPVSTYRDAPAIGAHTDEVLADWLGLPPEEIGRLRASNTI